MYVFMIASCARQCWLLVFGAMLRADFMGSRTPSEHRRFLISHRPRALFDFRLLRGCCCRHSVECNGAVSPMILLQRNNGTAAAGLVLHTTQVLLEHSLAVAPQRRLTRAFCSTSWCFGPDPDPSV